MADPDILIIGGGAAGIMAALAARGTIGEGGEVRDPSPDAPHVTILEGAPKLGAKILISGGGRCNLGNAEVGIQDFQTDAPHSLQAALKEFPAERVRTFFTTRGISVETEAMGKWFPREGRASKVLDALAQALAHAGADVRLNKYVTGIESREGRWLVTCQDGSSMEAPKIILATGGKSVPRTGSRGFGMEWTDRMGLPSYPAVPALAPLLLEKNDELLEHAGLTLPLLLTLAPANVSPDRLAGKSFQPLARSAGYAVITHNGISGPAALDLSGWVAENCGESKPIQVFGDFWTLAGQGNPLLGPGKPPGACLPPTQKFRPVTEAVFRAQVGEGKTLGQALSPRVARRLLDSRLDSLGLSPAQPVSQVSSSAWRKIYQALVHAELPVRGTAGLEKAEVTRGGVALRALDRRTLKSPNHPGIYLCGEVINVDGRLGGFNFHWAWASGFLAGRGAATG